jgi:ADP-L-glycero-D-manno-heptose 6-epimerase
MIVLTGGAGMIGSAFLWKLNQEKITDVVVVDNLGTSDKWKNLNGRTYLEYIHKNAFLERLNGDARFAKDITAIVHLGACSTTIERNADYLYENNVKYSQALARFASDRGVRFIYASSGATYGDGAAGYDDDEAGLETLRPLNMYGYSKHLFDLWARNQEILSQSVGVKFFNVYGPHEYHKGPMISAVMRSYYQLKKTGSIDLFKSYRPEFQDGQQKRDFVYIKDCVETLWWFLKNPRIHGIFNLGFGVPRTWEDLAKAVCSACNKEPAIRFIDMPEEVRAHYQYYTAANMTKLRAAGCPIQFHTLEDGVRDYVQEYLESGKLFL